MTAKRGFTVRAADAVPTTEYSPTFIQGMVDRMSVSFFKLEERLAKYRATKNLEYLIDAANFAMIEFMAPSLPGATFAPTDSDGSIGRVSRATGRASFKDNASI